MIRVDAPCPLCSHPYGENLRCRLNRCACQPLNHKVSPAQGGRSAAVQSRRPAYGPGGRHLLTAIPKRARLAPTHPVLRSSGGGGWGNRSDRPEQSNVTWEGEHAGRTLLRVAASALAGASLGALLVGPAGWGVAGLVVVVVMFGWSAQ